MKGSVHLDNRLKKSRWFVSIYWQGKRYKIRKHPVTGEPFTSKESAEKQLGRIRTEIDEGYFNPACWKTSSPFLVRTYAKNWLDAVEVSPKTLRGYKSAVNNYIIPFFDDRDIRHVRYTDIVQFHKWIELSDKGKKNVVSTLKTMMNFAYRNEDIHKVPPFPSLSYQEPEIEYLRIAVPQNHEKLLQFFSVIPIL